MTCPDCRTPSIQSHEREIAGLPPIPGEVDMEMTSWVNIGEWSINLFQCPRCKKVIIEQELNDN